MTLISDHKENACICEWSSYSNNKLFCVLRTFSAFVVFSWTLPRG